MLLNIFMVVYRESFEAILIIAILWAILQRQNNPAKYRVAVLSGIGSGLMVSVLLAVGLMISQSELSAKILDHFNNILLVIAVILITHMCIWMKVHGRKLKTELEQQFEAAKKDPSPWAIVLLAASAVAREGVETVIFLFGSFYEATGTQLISYSAVAGAGLCVAGLTWFLLNRGFRFFNPRVFFAVTTAFLFITASHFVVIVTRNLVQAGTIPALIDTIYDFSEFLPEYEGFGKFLSSFLGYQATPSLMTMLTWAGYWAIALLLYYKNPYQHQPKRPVM